MADDQLYSNNARTTLAADITSVATTINVVDGTVFSAPSAGEYELATIDDDINIEIVKITSIATNALTVVRAQEGTTGTAFVADNVIAARLTKESLERFLQLEAATGEGTEGITIQKARSLSTNVASGANAIAVGSNSLAYGSESVSIGKNATAKISGTVSIGNAAAENNHFTLSYWVASTAVLKSDLVLESAGDNVLVCIQAGTTGGTEPTVNDFEFVTDNTAIWYSLGA